MKTVWKYSIDAMREVVGTFFVPAGGRIVHVAAEAGRAVSLWIEVETDQPKEVRVFELFGTGHEASGVFVGTAVMPPLVLHVYERDLESGGIGEGSDA